MKFELEFYENRNNDGLWRISAAVIFLGRELVYSVIFTTLRVVLSLRCYHVAENSVVIFQSFIWQTVSKAALIGRKKSVAAAEQSADAV